MATQVADPVEAAAASAREFWSDSFGDKPSVSVDAFLDGACSSLTVANREEARIIAKFILGEGKDKLLQSIVLPYFTCFGSPQNALGQLGKNLLDETGCVIEGFLGTMERNKAKKMLLQDPSAMNYTLRFSHSQNTFVLGYERAKPIAGSKEQRRVHVSRVLKWAPQSGKWSESSRKGVEFDTLIEAINYFRQSNLPVSSEIYLACRAEVPVSSGMYALAPTLDAPAEDVVARDEQMGSEAYLTIGDGMFDLTGGDMGA